MLAKIPKRIICTRHPECLHNVDHEGALRNGVINRESPLTQVGELQRDIVAKYLRSEFPDIDTVSCSTFARTHAIPIAAGLESIMQETSLLDERDMGVWHIHLRAEVLRRHPGEEDRLKAAGYYAYEAPGGESCMDVEDRLEKLLVSGLLGDPDSTAYLSGHGISGLCLRRLLTGASVEEWYSWDRPKNASISVYERCGTGFVCVSYNQAPWEGVIDPTLLKRKSTEA